MVSKKVLSVAALAVAVWAGGSMAQTITVRIDGDGWDGLTLTLVAEGGKCTGKVLHKAVGHGNGDYFFKGVRDGDYVLCVNKDVSVDVSVSDEGTVISPGLLEFDGQ